MVRAGRPARIQVNATDIAGQPGPHHGRSGRARHNIDEVHHQRAFTMLAAQNVAIDLVLQTRGHEHVAQVLAKLRGMRLRPTWRDGKRAGIPL